MDKLILIPEEVRGLGDIVSPKQSSDFYGYDSNITQSTDSEYGTVYTSSQSSSVVATVTMEHPSSVTGDDESFSVVVKVYVSGVLYPNQSVYLDVNGTVYTGTSTATFTVPVDDSEVYYLRAWSEQYMNETAGVCTGTVYRVDGVDSVELFVEKSIIQTGNSDRLLSRVKNNGEPVKGVIVEFYKEE